MKKPPFHKSVQFTFRGIIWILKDQEKQSKKDLLSILEYGIGNFFRFSKSK